LSFTTVPPPASGPKPLLPVSMTIGGVPAFIEAAGLAAGQTGVEQINFIAPSSVPQGAQPVVVTVAGVASKPVSVVVK
jgi:uncharacterized protein (TIGR03437 family)